MTKPIALLVLVVCGGCFGRGGDLLDSDEQDAFDRGGDSHLASQAALGLSDDLFQFDPTIDAAKTALENAASVRTNAMTQLNGCGSVTINMATVTISFGAAPGCTMKSGAQASGTVAIGITKTGSTTTLMVTFTQVVVNGTDLAGTASFSTTTGSAFATTFNLTSKGATVSGTVMVTGSVGSMSFDGTVMQTKGGTTTAATFTGVVWKKGDCYPSAGTVKISLGIINETVTFSATTPTTGEVQVKLGAKTSTVKLPAYGKCPP